MLVPVNRTGFENWRPVQIIEDRTEWPLVFPPLKYIPEEGNHWQLPAETQTLGGGDCEDLATAWLHYLFLHGEKPPRLHLIVGTVPNGFHAVGMQGLADNIGTRTNTYFECRARKPDVDWRTGHIMRDDFKATAVLSLDGSNYIVGHKR